MMWRTMTPRKETEITVVDEASESEGEGPGIPCLVVFYGSHIGRRYKLEHAETVVGRSVAAGIQVDQDSASRQHAMITVQEGVSRIRDLGSTNGTWVNDTRIKAAELHDGDLLRIGQTIFKYLSGSNLESRYHDEIFRLSNIDGLTNAYNKRYFEDALRRELNRAQRYERVLSLVLFDLDHFKQVNDTHGHLAGDHVLRELAGLVLSNLRRDDIMARFGGEEFAVLLPEVDLDDARAVCEKLRTLIESHVFKFNETAIPVTVSLGLVSYTARETIPSPQDLLTQADAKLYEAKSEGRNRVAS